jgi:hypothetical protein
MKDDVKVVLAYLHDHGGGSWDAVLDRQDAIIVNQ